MISLYATALLFHLSKIFRIPSAVQIIFFLPFFFVGDHFVFQAHFASRIYVPLYSFAIFYILLTLKSVSATVVN